MQSSMSPRIPTLMLMNIRAVQKFAKTCHNRPPGTASNAYLQSSCLICHASVFVCQSSPILDSVVHLLSNFTPTPPNSNPTPSPIPTPTLNSNSGWHLSAPRFQRLLTVLQFAWHNLRFALRTRHFVRGAALFFPRRAGAELAFEPQ